MIELNVVDLVVSLGLESLEDNGVLLLADLQLHGVEDGSEPGVSNEPALALVFVLEEGLDEEALVAHEPAEALHASIEDLLFIRGKLVLGVQNRGCIELEGLLQGVLLKILQGKDLLHLFVELHVVDLGRVVRYGEVLLKKFKFLIGEVDLLSIKNTSELLRSDGTLSQDIMILEELLQADSVLLDLRLELEYELVELGLTIEHVDLADVLGLSALISGRLRSEGVGVVDELEVLHFVLVGAVDLHDGLELGVGHGEA